jgi:HD-GYP domain-containing protein (c-di-GMP phosphodiesterase class II)
MDGDTTRDLLQSLFVLAGTVEARDPYTGGHLWRVSQYCRLLGEKIGLPRAALGVVAVGGFLHDLGKIAVPDAVLGKRGPLTADEREVVRAHPEIGAGLVARHPLGPLVIRAVRHHHERIDGEGYPDRLRGGEVPAEARIVAIADAFDAITSTRPYRTAMPVEHALGIVRGERGRQFDAELAEAFLEIARDGALDTVVAHSEPGIPLVACPVCGPVVAATRRDRSAGIVLCPSCGAEMALGAEPQRRRAEPTGRTGTAAERVPRVDHDLLAELAADIGPLLHASGAAVAPS